MSISSDDVLVRRVAQRNPFRVEQLCWFSRLHMAAFRPRRRLSKRLVGRPAKKLFKFLFKQDWFVGQSSFALQVGGDWRRISFSPRNMQFGALYMPQNQPIYEPETSALLDILVADDSVFFDIGANWGYYAAYLASRDGFQGRVEAFEPFPSTHQDLVSTVEQSGLSDTIGVHGIALSDRDGTANMAAWDGLQSGLARLGDAENPNTARVDVPLRQLDSVDLPTPDVIKIDAEDHEEEVLRGAKDLLESARPIIVFENWLHPDNVRLTLGPLNFLADQGYRFFIIGWQRGGKDGSMVPDLPAAGNDTVSLALIPFLPESRFFLSQQLNILAVPEDKMDQLREKFDHAGG